MYLYNMQKMNIQLLILGKGVTVKAYISFEKKLVLFVIAVFALCTGIYFELVTLSYLIHVYIENRFLGSLYKSSSLECLEILYKVLMYWILKDFFLYIFARYSFQCVYWKQKFFSKKKNCTQLLYNK